MDREVRSGRPVRERVKAQVLGVARVVQRQAVLDEPSAPSDLPLSVRARRMLGLGVALAILLAVWASGSSFLVTLTTTVAIEAVAAMSLTVLVGWAGQAAVMSAALLLLGGYAAVLVPARTPGSLLWGVLLALVVGGLAGVLSGLPSRRMNGMYLLLSTLAVQFIVTDVANDIQSRQNASAGYYLAPPSLFGFHLAGTTAWLWVSGLAAMATYMYYRYLSRTRLGRNLELIRGNRGAADMSGIRTFRSLLLIFGITSSLTAAAGALLAYNTGNVSYDGFGVLVSVSYFVMIVIGGLGSLGGAVFGTAFVVGVPAWLNVSFSQAGPTASQTLAYGEVLAYVVVSSVLLLGVPGGAGGLGRALLSGLAKRLRAARSRQRDTVPGASLPAPPDAARRVAPGTPSAPGPLLHLSGVSVRYGSGEPALDEVSLDVRAGECVAVLGRNGAGKTSLLHAIAGFPYGSSGRVVRGEIWLRHSSVPLPLTGLASEARARAGVSLIPAEDKVFPSLTVAEHLRDSAGARPGRALDAAFGKAFAMFPDLQGVLARQAGLLSGGERQQLALASALLGRPSVLLVDELSLGLAPVAIDRLVSQLRTLRRDRSVTILVVEQNLGVARRLADRLILMDRGRVVKEGDAGSARWAEIVKEAYLGAGHDGAAPAPVD